MKYTLTISQEVVLMTAPPEWDFLPANISTSALRLAGLIEIRDGPGPRTLDRAFQWRASATGTRLKRQILGPTAQLPKPAKEITPAEPRKRKRIRVARPLGERIHRKRWMRPRPQLPVDAEGSA
jgi:hypothetical protein